MGYKSTLKIGFLFTAILTPLLISNLLHPLMVAVVVFCGGIVLTYFIAVDYVKEQKIQEMALMIKSLENISKIRAKAEIMQTLALWGRALVAGTEYYTVFRDELIEDKWKKIINTYQDESGALIIRDKALIPPGLTAVLFFPLIINEKLTAYLILASDEADKIKPYHIKLLEPLVKMAVNIMANEESQEYERLWQQEIFHIANRAREAYSPNMIGHGERVAKLAVKIARVLGLNTRELQELEYAALLHDIGQIEILYASLNVGDPDEQAATWAYADHPRLGAELFPANDDYMEIRRAILYHHEHYDGSGYPEGLSYTDIPLAARIIAVADTYDALTNLADAEERKTHAEALKLIKGQITSKFDPLVVVALEEVEEI